MKNRWRDMLRGAGQIFDLGGTIAPKREDIGLIHDARDDARALCSDWEAVERDMECILGSIGESTVLGEEVTK